MWVFWGSSSSREAGADGDDGMSFLSFQMWKVALVPVLLALLALSGAEEGARLLASKSLLNRYAVEGRDLTLQYNIYNVGSRWVRVHHLL